MMFSVGVMYGIHTKPIKPTPVLITKKFEAPSYEPTMEDHPEAPAVEPATFPVDELTIVHTDEKVEYEDLDQFCLAKNIYHEARGEDLLGQLAVAQVTLNRVESSRYPNDFCHIVMQKFQFSWANKASRRWTHPTGKAWENAKHIATQFLEYGLRVEGLETALYYHADYVDPKWKDSNAFIAQVGTHLFYERAKPL